jgi:diguanylate cyclase
MAYLGWFIAVLAVAGLLVREWQRRREGVASGGGARSGPARPSRPPAAGGAPEGAGGADPREERIDEAAQQVRRLLLSITDQVQKTDSATSSSSQVLTTARARISEVDLNNAGRVQELFLAEIDKVIQSNQKLKEQLGQTRAELETHRREIDNLKTAVRKDGLTKLDNRASLDEHLASVVRQAKGRGEGYALLMLDIDHFKKINDTFGHQVGDAVLTTLGTLLKETCRPTDFIARYGGEEFCLLLPGADGPGAAERAERLRERVQRFPFRRGKGEEVVPVTISIGAAAFHPDDTVETWVERADNALYRAKEEGRNRVALAGERAGV